MAVLSSLKNQSDDGIGLAMLRGYGGRDRLLDKRECTRNALAAVGGEDVDGPLEFPAGSAPLANDDWRLSLSHSGSWLLAGAVRTRIGGRIARLGVDVERHRRRDFDGIGRFLGWPSPCRGAAHFYRRWTLAEALYKAVGRDARCWFDVCEDAAADASTPACAVETAGWFWRIAWPAWVGRGTVCVVLGLSS